MDFETSLRRAIKTGSVLKGQKSTVSCIEAKNARMVIIASNCPGDFREYLTSQEDITVYTYEGSGMQLGKSCGKPFMVSALTIVDPGESDILSFARA